MYAVKKLKKRKFLDENRHVCVFNDEISESILSQVRMKFLKTGKGRLEKLEALYEAYKQPMLKTAYILFRDPAAAEDAVQEIFLKLAKRPEAVKGIKQPGKYLFSCIANEARNYYRDMGKKPQRVSLCEPVENCNPPDRWLILSEELETLSRAMDTLSYEQKETVLLHVEAGMKFREIAKLEGISINTVMSRYRYGIEKLRNQLNGEVLP